MNYLTVDEATCQRIKNEVRESGYSVVHDMVKLDVFDEMYNKWKVYFEEGKYDSYVVRGGLRLGEKNFSSFSVHSSSYS